MKSALTAAMLLAGIALAAYGMTEKLWLLALLGVSMIFVFFALLQSWIEKLHRPAVPIQPAADAAWNLKDRPADAPALPSNDGRKSGAP
jgi:hypothetical protein